MKVFIDLGPLEARVKTKPIVKFEGVWRRIDIIKAYRMMLNEYPKHISKIKQENEKIKKAEEEALAKKQSEITPIVPPPSKNIEGDKNETKGDATNGRVK